MLSALAGQKLFRRRAGVLGLAIACGMVVVAIFAPRLAPYDPLDMGAELLAPPSRRHLFGTDELGRDLASRVIVASRISVLGSLGAVALATLAGVPLGLTAGLLGGGVDYSLMRVVDFMLAVPPILLAMVIMAVLGPSSQNAIMAVAIATWPTFARLARASTLAEKEKDYVLASRSMGATNQHLIFRAILPNCLSPILVQIVVSISYAVLLEATLSFLGLGTQPPDSSWGLMLSWGRSYLHMSVWYGIFPGVALTLFVLGLSMVADALQEVSLPASRS